MLERSNSCCKVNGREARGTVTTRKQLPHATMEDVARAAGVSRALVSLALRGSTRVSEESRARIVAAADELGYRPNALASQLASKGRVTLGVLLNDLHNPFFAEIHDGIQDAAESLGYQLLLTTGHRRDRGEQAAIDMMLAHRVDAMVLSSPRLPSSVIKADTTRTPAAVIGRRVQGPQLDSVMADDTIGTALVLEHLMALGHRHIVHLDGGRGAGADRRRAAFVAAVQRVGLGEPDVVHGDFTEEAGVRAVEKLLERPSLPTALFAANDLEALGAMAALEAAGLSVPDDVSVMGYDNTFVAGLRHVALTTIDQPRALIGRLAVQMVHERLTGARTAPRHEAIAPTLVVRQTTAAPRRP